MDMKAHADDLARRRARAAQMGGDEAVARQHAAGKLTARERLALLFDPQSFVEIGAHATHHRSEIATMLTILSGSPPDTGINTWELIRTGQTR